MKKLLLLFVVVSLFVGCSEKNSITAGSDTNSEYISFTADGEQVSINKFLPTDGADGTDGTIEPDQVPEFEAIDFDEQGELFSTYGLGIQEKYYSFGLSFWKQTNTQLPVTYDINVIMGTSDDSSITVAGISWVNKNLGSVFLPDTITGTLTVTAITDTHVTGTFQLNEIGHIEDGNSNSVTDNVTMQISNGEFNLKYNMVSLEG